MEGKGYDRNDKEAFVKEEQRVEEPKRSIRSHGTRDHNNIRHAWLGRCVLLWGMDLFLNT